MAPATPAKTGRQPRAGRRSKPSTAAAATTTTPVPAAPGAAPTGIKKTRQTPKAGRETPASRKDLAKAFKSCVRCRRIKKKCVRATPDAACNDCLEGGAVCEVVQVDRRTSVSARGELDEKKRAFETAWSAYMGYFVTLVAAEDTERVPSLTEYIKGCMTADKFAHGSDVIFEDYTLSKPPAPALVAEFDSDRPKLRQVREADKKFSDRAYSCVMALHGILWRILLGASAHQEVDSMVLFSSHDGTITGRLVETFDVDNLVAAEDNGPDALDTSPIQPYLGVFTRQQTFDTDSSAATPPSDTPVTPAPADAVLVDAAPADAAPAVGYATSHAADDLDGQDNLTAQHDSEHRPEILDAEFAELAGLLTRAINSDEPSPTSAPGDAELSSPALDPALDLPPTNILVDNTNPSNISPTQSDSTLSSATMDGQTDAVMVDSHQTVIPAQAFTGPQQPEGQEQQLEGQEQQPILDNQGFQQQQEEPFPNNNGFQQPVSQEQQHQHPIDPRLFEPQVVQQQEHTLDLQASHQPQEQWLDQFSNNQVFQQPQGQQIEQQQFFGNQAQMPLTYSPPDYQLALVAGPGFQPQEALTVQQTQPRVMVQQSGFPVQQPYFPVQQPGFVAPQQTQFVPQQAQNMQFPTWNNRGFQGALPVDQAQPQQQYLLGQQQEQQQQQQQFQSTPYLVDGNTLWAMAHRRWRTLPAC